MDESFERAANGGVHGTLESHGRRQAPAPPWNDEIRTRAAGMLMPPRQQDSHLSHIIDDGGLTSAMLSLEALKPRIGSRKRRRSWGLLPSEREVKAAAACDDDLPAARLTTAGVLPGHSAAFTGSLEEIITQACLIKSRSYQISDPPPFAPPSSLHPMAATPSYSSALLPQPSMSSLASLTSLTSFPSSNFSSSQLDLLSRALGVHQSIIPHTQRSHVASGYQVNKPTHAASSIFESTQKSSGYQVNKPAHAAASIFESAQKSSGYQVNQPSRAASSKQLNPPVAWSPESTVKSSLMNQALAWSFPVEELRRLQAAAQGPRVPPSYECKECGRSFNLPQSLGGHMSRHKREERVKILRKRKADVETHAVAESLCKLQKAASFPDSSDVAGCAAGASTRSLQNRGSKVAAVESVTNGVDTLTQQQQQQQQQQQRSSLEAIIESQKRLLHYQQLLHQRLTTLPDQLLVPPVLPLPSPAQLHQDVSCETVSGLGAVDVSPPAGGIDASVGVKKLKLERSGACWDVAVVWPSTKELQNGLNSTCMRRSNSTSGSHKLDFDLNLSPEP